MTLPPGSGYRAGAAPGWYPDPSGDYEFRWFDGTGWSDAVVTGAFRTDDPLVPVAALEAYEHVLWSQGADVVTTHHITFGSTDPARDPVRFEIWMVSGVATRSGTDFGDVEVTIGYPGYTGRVTWVLRRVQGAGAVGASVRKQANRVRRALGGA